MGTSLWLGKIRLSYVKANKKLRIIELNVNHNHPTNVNLYKLYPTVQGSRIKSRLERFRVSPIWEQVSKRSLKNSTITQAQATLFYSIVASAPKSTLIQALSSQTQSIQSSKQKVESCLKSSRPKSNRAAYVDIWLTITFIKYIVKEES